MDGLDGRGGGWVGYLILVSWIAVWSGGRSDLGFKKYEY